MEIVHVPLSQGKVALIDAADAERVGRFKWSALRRKYTWYAVRHIWGRAHQATVPLHRFILDAPDGVKVDHVNGDGLDNRRANLRLATTAQNSANQHNNPRRSASGFLGVTWDARGSEWRAKVKANRVTHNLGAFATAEDAARARDIAARDLHGEFARYNFPDDLPDTAPDWRKPPRRSSPYPGVAWRKDAQRWTARIPHAGGRRFLGYFATAEDAWAAVERARVESS